MTTARRNLALGLFFGLAAAITWGSQAVVARAGTLAGFSPLDLSVLRFATAGLILLPFAWRGRHALARVGPWRLLALACCGGFGNSLLFGGGVVFAPATHGGTIAPITAAVTGALFAIPALGEVPTRGRVVALAGLALGLVLLGWDGLQGDHPGAWRGDILLFLAGSIWGAFTVLLRRWAVPALPATAAICAISALVVIPPWVLLGFGAVPDLFWRDAALQMGGQGIMSSVIAISLYAKATELLGATRAACVSTMMPVAALILSVTLLGESLGPLKVAGVALAVAAMLGAVLFTGRRGAAR